MLARTCRRLVTATLAAALCAAGLITVAVRPALALSTTADTTWMADGRVYASARLGQTLYIGGLFTHITPPAGGPGSAYAANGLAAINLVTGEGIPGWTPDVTKSGGVPVVRSLAVSTDGTQLYIGGNFDHIDGVPVRNFARIAIGTGHVDASFAPQVGSPTSTVFTILPAGHTIYFGGLFGSVAGRPRDRLAAVGVDGTLDPNWIPSADEKVQDLTYSADGATIFVAGHFTTINGVPRQSVARLTKDTGALDPWAIPDGTITGPQTGWSLVATPTRLYAGFGSTGPNYLAAFRLDDGNAGTQLWRFSTVGNVQTISLTPSGNRLFFGGHFGLGHGQQKVCGIPLHGLASVDPSTGNVDCGWVPQLEPYGDNFNGPWTIVTTGTYMWVGGGFKKIAGVSHLNLARFTL